MTTNRNDIILYSADLNLKQIDINVKNVWRWSWLETCVDGIYLKDTIRKIRTPGRAYCILCSQELIYGSKGLPALENHVKRSKHRNRLQLRNSQAALDGK